MYKSAILGINIPEIEVPSAIDGIWNEIKLKTRQGKLILDLNELPQYLLLPEGIEIN